MKTFLPTLWEAESSCGMICRHDPLRGIAKCPPTCPEQLLDAFGQGKPLARRHCHHCCKPTLWGSQGWSHRSGACLSSGVLGRAPLWGCCPSHPPLPCGFPVLLEGPDGFTQQPHGGQRLLPTCVHKALPRKGGGGVWGKRVSGDASPLAGCFPFPDILPATAMFPLQRPRAHPTHSRRTCPSPAAPLGEPGRKIPAGYLCGSQCPCGADPGCPSTYWRTCPSAR